MRFHYLLITLVAATFYSIIGLFLYAKILKRLKQDIIRIPFFLVSNLLCLALPLFFFHKILNTSGIKGDSWERFIVIACWIIPVFTVALYLKKKGYFDKEKKVQNVE